ncbi:unnamed protein product [Caenorhabditis auriculariae]|uniref:BolA-like protein 3 n=1 Tax=Caenorhabditis auriculariae TaxID=2777116 RepID=A0A8S1GPF4_9PELO|nr:unnamed protein product [Caenorhabditis auriculariae]
MLNVSRRLGDIARRTISSSWPSMSPSNAEKTMADQLRCRVEGCTEVVVEDVSNGCGSMFNVFVEATSFQGKTKVQQHKIVTGILREQIKDMHGLTITTQKYLFVEKNYLFVVVALHETFRLICSRSEVIRRRAPKHAKKPFFVKNSAISHCAICFNKDCGESNTEMIEWLKCTFCALWAHLLCTEQLPRRKCLCSNGIFEFNQSISSDSD